VGDLRQRAAFFKEALEPKAVQGQLLGLNLRASSSGARVASEEGRYSLMATCCPSLSSARYTDAKAASGHLAHDAVAADQVYRGQGSRA